jgi:beta-lactam-binding protein with PASTA domain
LQATPARDVNAPNVIGMKACKAVRTLARSGVDDWRIAGHEHGYTCDETVVGQSPAGHVIRRHGLPVIVTLRLGRR